MPAPVVVDVRLVGAPSPAGLAHVCARVAARLRAGGVASVVCDAQLLTGEVAAVEALARLSLVARRAGAAFSVRGMSPELLSLVELLGLLDVLGHRDVGPPDSGSGPAGHWDGGWSVRTVAPQAHRDRRGGLR